MYIALTEIEIWKYFASIWSDKHEKVDNFIHAKSDLLTAGIQFGTSIYVLRETF